MARTRCGAAGTIGAPGLPRGPIANAPDAGTEPPTPADRDRLTVLYDADCGVCRLTVRALRTLDWRRHLVLVPLQRYEATGSGDPSRRQLLSALHVRDARGRWRRGGDAMLRIASVIPALVPLAVIGRLPGMRRPVEAMYGLVAGHRVQIGRILDGAIRLLRPG